MGYEIIHCFNGQDCIYKECRWWSESGDNCKWTLTGIREDQYVKLFDGETKSDTPAPVAQTPPTPQEVREHAATHVEGTRNIGDLKPGDKSAKGNKINIKGTLKFDPTERETNTGKTVANALIQDNTGEIRLSFWEKAAADIMQYKKGDSLFIEGLYQVKEPWDGTLQGDAGNYYKMVKVN